MDLGPFAKPTDQITQARDRLKDAVPETVPENYLADMVRQNAGGLDLDIDGLARED